jgi:hypothetical protein
VNAGRWFKGARRALRRRLDAKAVERMQLEHEEAERRGADPRTPIPGMRHIPWFDGHQGGL